MKTAIAILTAGTLCSCTTVTTTAPDGTVTTTQTADAAALALAAELARGHQRRKELETIHGDK